jgi:hypothetical protein
MRRFMLGLVVVPLFVACSSDETNVPVDGGADGAVADGAADAPGDGAPAPAPGCPNVGSDPDVAQVLPQATVDTSYPVQTGKVITVKQGDDLQTAIDGAALGDTLELAAGATFKGPITLPNKTGSGWLVIRTATPDGSFAKPGVRVTPALAPKMAKIEATGAGGVSTANGAHHVRLVGLEITPAAGQYVNALVALNASTTNVADLPHDIVVDRSYLHADPIGGRRGVALNGKSLAVVDSWLSGFREKGADSQAIAGWNGPGPFRIVNDYLEGASENVMFGGADPSIPNLVPSDIQICGNYVKKDPAWKGGNWVMKNLFELKNARRVLVAGNVFENSFADAQVGFAILFTVRNQDGTAPWSTVEDVTFAYNVVRHVASGLNVSASDDLHPSQETARILFADNVIDDVNPATFGGQGRPFQFIYGGGKGKAIKIDHNTVTTADNAALVLGDTAKYGTGFFFTNNVVARGQYGVFGSGQSEGKSSLDFYLASYTMTKNVFFSASGGAATYPAGNFVPATPADVAFAPDLSLGAGSKYKGAATDGKDPGADVPKVLAATAAAAP